MNYICESKSHNNSIYSNTKQLDPISRGGGSTNYVVSYDLTRNKAQAFKTLNIFKT